MRYPLHTREGYQELLEVALSPANRKRRVFDVPDPAPLPSRPDDCTPLIASLAILSTADDRDPAVLRGLAPLDRYAIVVRQPGRNGAHYATLVHERLPRS